MTGFIENLHDPKNAATALCIEGDRVFRVGDLRADIDRLCPALRASSRIAIHCQSARLFLIAINAAWRAGATVIFPATDRPAYLDGIRDQFDLYLDDAAINAKLTDAPSGSFDAGLPAASDCHAVFFTSGSTGDAKPIPKTLALIEAEITIAEITIQETALAAAHPQRRTHCRAGIASAYLWSDFPHRLAGDHGPRLYRRSRPLLGNDAGRYRGGRCPDHKPGTS